MIASTEFKFREEKAIDDDDDDDIIYPGLSPLKGYAGSDN
jgi:hypothetical protein